MSESKFKRHKTVQAECPRHDTTDALNCCCQGAKANRPEKNCHNLRTKGQFCDSCKQLNRERSSARKRKHQEEARQAHLHKLQEAEKVQEAAFLREQAQLEMVQKLQEAQRVQEAAFQRDQIQRDEDAQQLQSLELERKLSPPVAGLYPVPSEVRTRGFEVLRSFMLHVRDELRVVATERLAVGKRQCT
jgi:hypothetical protein